MKHNNSRISAKENARRDAQRSAQWKKDTLEQAYEIEHLREYYPGRTTGMIEVERIRPSGIFL